MPEVSLTTFLDFVSKSGMAKLGVVREWKNKPKYHPSRDYYKPVRDTIVGLHESGGAMAALDGLLLNLSSDSKVQNYEAVIQGYRKWRGRKGLTWFEPPNRTWTHAELDINVNPELGLEINGEPHVIKLYFKADTLSKGRIAVVNRLMNLACAEESPEGSVMSILDLRRARLHMLAMPNDDVDTQLKAEVAFWMSAWPNV